MSPVAPVPPVPPVRVLIVDDEEPCRRGLRLLLSGDPEVAIVAECGSGSEAIEWIRSASPDVVFLDIQMPEVTGFEVIEAVGAERMPLVVFVTAFDQYAIRAFDVHAVDYVLKPFSRARFGEAVRRVKHRLADKTLLEQGRALLRVMQEFGGRRPGRAADGPLERILVQDGDRYRFLPIDDVLWIEGADDYVNLHCREGAHLYRCSLKAVEERLPSRFARIHRSAIVNIGAIREVSTNEHRDLVIVLASGHRLRVSKRRRGQLLEQWESRFGFR